MIRASEFQYDPSRVPIFVADPMGPSFQRLAPRLEETGEYQVVLCDGPLEVLPLVRKMETCVVVGYVDSSDSMMKHVNMLRLLGPSIEQGLVRVIVTHTLEIADIVPVERLRYSGCSELLPEPVQERSLLFKLSRAAKGLSKRLSNPGDLEGNSPDGQSGVPRARRAKIQEVPALVLESDFWLTLHGGARKIGDRWTVRLTGPAPSAGRWIEIDAIAPGSRSWQWTPLDPSKDVFIKEQGAWIFTGTRAPEYQGDLWWFTGREPALEFYYEGESYGAKFRVDESDTLMVAKDSEYAQGAITAIVASRDRVVKQIGGASRPSRAPADFQLSESAPTDAPEETLPTAPADVPVSAPVMPAAAPEPAPAQAAAPAQTPAATASPVSTLAQVTVEKRASPLAAAFLASELLRRREFGSAEMANRYCEYVSQSVGGARVELWVRVKAGQPWVCVGTHDRKSGQLHAHVDKAGERFSQDSEILVSGPIELPDGREGRIAMQGMGMDRLPEDYADQIGPAAHGILRSFKPT